jgi:hypothetical protein
MTIHWKDLEEHFLMILLWFILGLNIFEKMMWKFSQNFQICSGKVCSFSLIKCFDFDEDVFAKSQDLHLALPNEHGYQIF